MFAAHLGNGAKRTQPVAALGDFQKSKVPRRDPQPVAIRKRRARSGLKHGPLFVETADQPVGNLGHLLATKNANQVIDARARFQQGFLVALGEAAGNDDAPGRSAAFQFEHLTNRGERLFASSLDEAASVDNDEIGTFRLVNQAVAVELQQSQHPLAIDEVLGAAQADEGIGALRRPDIVGGRSLGRADDWQALHESLGPMEMWAGDAQNPTEPWPCRPT